MTKFAVLATLLALSSCFGSGQGQDPPPGELIPSIVGGIEARPGEFPWIVSLQRGSSHSCGASIINENWIVTAAHCTQGPLSGYTAVAGEHDLKVKEGTEQSRTIVKIVNHPSYKKDTSENDISLMKVSKPFTLDKRVQSVKLPPSGFRPTAMTTAAGWGGTSEGGSGSTKLLKVDVPYIPDDKCSKSYPGRIKETMMCAGKKEGGKDSCQGDSGGPLMCKSGATSYLCGVVSWGTGCARKNSPGVYTEVSFYLSWINSVVKS